MQGKTIVFTGATSGLGEAAALNLAQQGARIVLIARDQKRADETLAKLKAAAPGAAHKAYIADFSRLADMKRAGALIASEEPQIDVLANNAGAIFSQRQITADGLEMTFAVNHMAHFVLTNALLNTLKATPGARIINTGSSAHGPAKLDLDDLSSERAGILRAYGLSKLCNMLHARELARRLEGTSVTANSFHPGFVASRFGDNTGLLGFLIGIGKNFRAISNEEGADTLIWLASSTEGGQERGGYFVRRKRAPASAEFNDINARKLWDASEAIAARG